MPRLSPLSARVSTTTRPLTTEPEGGGPGPGRAPPNTLATSGWRLHSAGISAGDGGGCNISRNRGGRYKSLRSIGMYAMPVCSPVLQPHAKQGQ